MVKYIVVTILLIIGLGLVAYYNSQDKEVDTVSDDAQVTPIKEEKDNPPADAQPVKELTKVIDFQGEKLAHNYYKYTSEDYAAAQNANRPIFLYFYANWCPTCAEQEPIIVSTMNSFKENNNLKDVVAFRVNYNDNATDEAEKSLAIEFGVLYQHTMFFLNKDGKITDQFIGQTREDILRESFTKII